MNWSDSISINAHYTRSIHLERDASSEDVVRAYIPTSRALKILSDFSKTLNTGTVPRSWALTGPYGSGKSSFAVFVSHLLEDPESSSARLAIETLKNADADLADQIEGKLKGSKGHCRVLLTGSPEPLAKRLLHAIYLGAKSYWSAKRGRTPLVVKQIEQAIADQNHSTYEVVEILKSLRTAVSKSGGSGILLVIDELGKFLEAEARNFGTNDIYLLQAVAEQACDKGSVPIHFFVLLHQSIELYAKGLGETLKHEWQKVQGRFESVPFLESVEQTLRVTRAAFIQDFDAKTKKKIHQELLPISKALEEASALPGVLDADAAVELFSGCYPLHPVSLLLLPLLCQRVAQNERTLFSYLGSRESHGLSDSITRFDSSEKNIPWVYPWEIYEYFILNQPVAVSDHFTHRRWAEVVTAVERLGDSSEDELHLIKSIGLMNIIGAKGGLKSSIELLECCTPFGKRKLKTLLTDLQEKSVISYRKYSGEYRIWQGSDFDLELELQNEIENGKGLELVDELNERGSFSPIVARRYTIKTGSLRYFAPLFADVKSIKRLEKKADEPRILFLLAGSPIEKELLVKKAASLCGGMTVAAVCSLGSEVKQAVQEVLALERIIRNNSKLSGDPVAQRELKDRLSAAKALEKQLLESVVVNPGQHQWLYANKTLQVTSRRALQFELSNILEEVYSKAPIIKNELLNRTKPSSSAISGRNKLIVAMLEHASLPELGIEKYPAEKAIYKSVLEATGLHSKHGGSWAFGAPAQNDPCKLKPTWDSILDFFERSEAQALPIADLFEELQLPPLGIKAGVIPVLFIASYFANQHELALYEDGHFCPVISHEVIERLIKNPNTFSVQRFRISGMRVSVYEKYMEMVTGTTYKKLDLIGLVRPLAKFMNGLPDHAKRTKLISKEAQAVRRVFFSAKSPASLLFEDVPIACGFPKFDAEASNGNEVKEFSEAFIRVLKELKDAYPNLLNLLQEKLGGAFPDSKAVDLCDFRNNLHGRFVGLERYTVDAEGVKAFVLRLCDEGFKDDQQWLESLAAFLGRKPAEKWNDDDLQLADFRLADFSERLHDLEMLRSSHEKNQSHTDVNFDSTLIRIMRQGEASKDRIIHTDEKKRLAYQGVASQLEKALDQLDEPLRLALLTDLLNSALNSGREKLPAPATTLKGKSLNNE
ncbi:hypothetical protein Ga0123462_0854 [Mariprofundus ferrinatatus]|uniref:ATP-binding protein n=1 Tax=Mariprofundus ferrinatatus TaxID=1921087 RepID=A0A2K8L390_9PROT|nr:hypothetical protein [Mariprofundus ferrinatatus]ATX81723.1 hypothetical protein Ga0123462_0854 [Mariprofundus ferrinatatus]